MGTQGPQQHVRRSWRATGFAISLAAVALGAAARVATGQVATSIRPMTVGDWITYNGDLTGDRFSALAEITPATVGGLRQVCAFETPDTVSFQSGIVAVGGTLYFTAFATTYAVDGATCALRWKTTRGEPATYLKVNRGVAYDNERVFRGSGDGHVYAMDAATGRILWDAAVADAAKGESVPMAPVAWQNLVFVGNAGGDNYGVTGRVSALDAATGRVVWQWDAIPDTGRARATWTRASATNPPSGGAFWTSFAIDPHTGVLYVNAGNPAPDFALALHPGPSLYTNSIIALDGHTGRMLSSVQPIPRDFHDWDVSAAPALITTRRGRTLLLAGAKDGQVYGIDRSGVTTSSTARSRGLSVRYRAAVTTRSNTTVPFSSTRSTHFCPGTQGGMEWNGPSYDPGSGLLFANAIDWCTSVKLAGLDTLHGKPGATWTGSDDPRAPFGHQDPVSTWRGWVTAVDAETGRVRWHRPMPKPMVAAITATAGGVVFTGDLDGNVLGLDARTGARLWSAPTGKAIGGGVISYTAAGTQHIAAATGMNSPIWPVTGGTARVVVYALP